MRIAYFSDTYLPNKDGVVSQILASKSELEKRGHYIHVFSTGTRSDKLANKDSTVTIYTGVKFPLYKEYKVALFPYRSIAKVYDLDLDVIHSHAIVSMGFPAVATAKALGLPLVGTFHTLLPNAMHYLTRNKRAQEVLSHATWRAIKAFYASFDLITAPSKAIASLMNEKGISNVEVVSNGLNLKKFNPHVSGRGKIREKFGFKQSDKVGIFVGRVVEEKNVDLLIKAARKVLQEVPEYKLLICGDGPDLERIKKITHAEGLSSCVKFTGYVPYSEIQHYFSVGDVCLTASTFETQCISILEGLACGLPGVAANSLALPEAVKDGYNGFLFEPENAGECAKKIVKVLSLSRRDCDRMKENSWKKAQGYSIEKVTTKWEKIYASLIYSKNLK